MITDFLIANVEEAQAVLAARLPSTRWQVLSGWKGLDPVKLQTLATATAEIQKKNKPKIKTPLLGGDPNAGPLLLEVGIEFRDLMAALSNAELVAIAEKWLATEELQNEGWSMDDAKRFIEEIRSFSAKAQAANKSLLIWMLW